MSYTIKTNISFDEYNAIINKVIEDCFIDGVYSPALYELSFRTSLISAFAPDYDLSECKDNNELWEKVTGRDSEDIIESIKQTQYYLNIKTAIDKGIQHHLAVLEASPMSLSDIALSKIFNIIADKINAVDTNMIDKNTIDALVTASNEKNSETFETNLIDAMVKKGVIPSPNRATRRRNIKQGKSNTPETNTKPKESDV